ASGLVARRHQFLGYLPRGERALQALADELARWPDAAVAFESPQRLAASLGVLARAIPDRQAAVCRELTKRFEEVRRGSVAELAEAVGEGRGEITLRVGAGQGGRPDESGGVGVVA